MGKQLKLVHFSNVKLGDTFYFSDEEYYVPYTKEEWMNKAIPNLLVWQIQ